MADQSVAPHVVIVGGYLTEPIFYWPMRRRLLRRGAGGVSVAQLHWPDWLAMSFAGMGPAMLRAARKIARARHASDAPLIVIGHSAGGILSRLAMSAEPIDGRYTDVHAAVGCLVTLGTPHRLHPTIGWHHPGVRATELLERTTPGAFHAPTTGYLTVGSTLTRPARRAPTNSVKQAVNRIMRVFVGETPGARGDGIVDNEMCQLAGVRHMALPDVLHGTFGGPWYGDADVIDRWWPAALEEWRAALAARDAPSHDPTAGLSPAALPALPPGNHPG